jgi:hypothetical protein
VPGALRAEALASYALLELQNLRHHDHTRCMATRVLSTTLSAASTMARAAISRSTTSKWPRQAAAKRGVTPICEARTVTRSSASCSAASVRPQAGGVLGRVTVRIQAGCRQRVPIRARVSKAGRVPALALTLAGLLSLGCVWCKRGDSSSAHCPSVTAAAMQPPPPENRTAALAPRLSMAGAAARVGRAFARMRAWLLSCLSQCVRER